MGIEYVVDLTCEVKNVIDADDLKEKMRLRSAAVNEYERLKREHANVQPRDIVIKRRQRNPWSPPGKETTVEAILEETKELPGLQHHCQRCPANHIREPFGCIGVIDYPVRARAEEWLLSLLPADLESPAGKNLKGAVTQFKLDGGPIAALRRRSSAFELKAPAKRKWGGFFSGWTITSDQLMQLFFCGNELHPNKCLLICHFVGIMPHNYADGAAANPQAHRDLVAKGDVPAHRDVSELKQMHYYLGAIKTAGRLGKKLLVDLG